MKITIIILSVLLGLFILFQLYLSMTAQKVETQAYNLIRAENEYEIRFYPSVTMAMITSSATSYKELGNTGFRKLAAYIFGANKEKKRIAMTSPVYMDIGDSVSSMSFVMPSNYNNSNLPLPNDSNVRFQASSDEYVAAIRFGGFASDDKIKKYTALLEASLKKDHLVYHGNFRYLGYNPPYQFVGRRNEIVVAITFDSKESIKLQKK